MKKTLMIILALIVAAVFVAVVVYYIFPEKTASFIIDKARSGAVFEKGTKNRQTVIIKDCGHVPMIEKPRQTEKRYLDFIENLQKK
ncbi:MAG TPA: alpha/beta hydrolase [Deltaproteobacteria bacterium]|nr:alpha/beta hydrolase [Deltaproteobacteria bacterium]